MISDVTKFKNNKQNITAMIKKSNKNTRVVPDIRARFIYILLNLHCYVIIVKVEIEHFILTNWIFDM